MSIETAGQHYRMEEGNEAQWLVPVFPAAWKTDIGGGVSVQEL